MYNMSNRFNTFYGSHVVLSQDKQNKLHEKKNLNIRRLKDGLSEYNEEHRTSYRLVETCVQGSVAMSTVVQNESGILDWDRIRYRYCGRHMTDLQYEDHFQTYELLLADIVELCPSPSQADDLERLASHCPEILRLASADEIYRMGVRTEERDLSDSIASHAFKILQDEEANLLSPPRTGNTYTARLR